MDEIILSSKITPAAAADVINCIDKICSLIHDEGHLLQLQAMKDFYYKVSTAIMIDEKRELTNDEKKYVLQTNGMYLNKFIGKKLRNPCCGCGRICYGYYDANTHEMIYDPEYDSEYNDDGYSKYLYSKCEEYKYFIDNCDDYEKRVKEITSVYNKFEYYLNDIYIQKFKLRSENKDKNGWAYLTGIHKKADELLDLIAIERIIEVNPELKKYIN